MATDPSDGTAEKEESRRNSTNGNENLNKEAARAKKEQEAVTDFHFEKESKNLVAATELSIVCPL